VPQQRVPVWVKVEIRSGQAHTAPPVVAHIAVDTLDAKAVGRIVQLIQKVAAGDGSPRPLSRSHSQLSDRETHVLRLVADGKDTHQIARELSYSERTVKNVLHDVTTRLQLRNRSHAVAYALREGLI
jgi:DNA-binding NarL/FixJ family response regulator